MAFATVNYFSRSLGKASALSVVFPDAPELEAPWTVLYLLHGLSDDHTIWSRRTSVERYVAGLPLVVVMPDGGKGWYCNAHQGDAYEDDLIKDVVGLVDRTFPVKAEKAGRAIGGLSMGGYGAVKLGLKRADVFGSVSAHSGAFSAARRDMGIAPEQARVFGPNSKDGPEDPYKLAASIDHGVAPAIRIDCGRDDFLLEDNREFHKHLTGLGLPHEYHEFAGGHDWAYWDEHVRDAIAFHVKTLKIKGA